MLGTVYNAVLRSNTTMLFAVFGSAFGLQLAFDTTSDKIWDNINRGVGASGSLRVQDANAGGSDNGRTSSSDTWRPPRTTSRRATRQRLKHDIDISLRFLGTDACDGHVFYQMRNTNPRR
ncbi:qcr9 subunit 9 of the ubiquinol cytochrome-c reductase complex [Exserohilum turcicum]